MVAHLTANQQSWVRIQLLPANSVSPEAGNHLGWHSTVCWPLKGGRGTQYVQKSLLKNIQEKKFLFIFFCLHQGYIYVIYVKEYTYTVPYI